MAEKKLEVKNLTISFKTDNGLVQAVRNVSFDLDEEETLCIVGESGSGKSVTSKAIMGILANNAVVEGGEILYEGENLLEVSEEEYHKIRGNKIGMIFQDPLSSLNPFSIELYFFINHLSKYSASISLSTNNNFSCLKFPNPYC